VDLNPAAIKNTDFQKSELGAGLATRKIKHNDRPAALQAS
jgi:hypothetical protein